MITKESNKLMHRLVHIERPILYLPNLAIHLDRESNDAFKLNKEDHLKPILATTAAEEICGTGVINIILGARDVE